MLSVKELEEKYGVTIAEIEEKICDGSYTSLEYTVEGIEKDWYKYLLIPTAELEKENRLAYRPAYFGEVLGEHSDPEGELTNDDKIDSFKMLALCYKDGVTADRLIDDEGEYPMPHYDFIVKLFTQFLEDEEYVSIVGLLSEAYLRELRENKK